MVIKMKKTFNKLICLCMSVFMLIGFAGCESGDIVETRHPSNIGNESQTVIPERPNVSEQSKEDSEIIIEPEDEIPYPLEMYFSSGAGAWYSTITIHADGSFEGEFQDTNMGELADEYPNGTVYYCNFSGKFTIPQKLTDVSYSLTLERVEVDEENKEDYIEDGVLYKQAYPYGIMNVDNSGYANDFILYTPEAETEGLREEFLFFWPERFGAEPNGKLNLYGLLNTETDEGFFSTSEYQYF